MNFLLAGPNELYESDEPNLDGISIDPRCPQNAIGGLEAGFTTSLIESTDNLAFAPRLWAFYNILSSLIRPDLSGKSRCSFKFPQGSLYCPTSGNLHFDILYLSFEDNESCSKLLPDQKRSLDLVSSTEIPTSHSSEGPLCIASHLYFEPSRRCQSPQPLDIKLPISITLLFSPIRRQKSQSEGIFKKGRKNGRLQRLANKDHIPTYPNHDQLGGSKASVSTIKSIEAPPPSTGSDVAVSPTYLQAEDQERTLPNTVPISVSEVATSTVLTELIEAPPNDTPRPFSDYIGSPRDSWGLLTCAQRTSTGDDTPQSAHTLSSQSPASRKFQNSKRGIERGQEDEPDKQQDGNKRSRTTLIDLEAEPEILEFACPFRKHNPQKYTVVGQWNHCARTPRQSVSRVKEHMLRSHRIPQCQRCEAVFETKAQLSEHGLARVACEVIDTKGEVVGINTQLEEWLKDKGPEYVNFSGKQYSKQTEKERWITIYKKFFPEDEVPSPYFEAPPKEELRPIERDSIASAETDQQEFLSGILQEIKPLVSRDNAIQILNICQYHWSKKLPEHVRSIIDTSAMYGPGLAVIENTGPWNHLENQGEYNFRYPTSVDINEGVNDTPYQELSRVEGPRKSLPAVTVSDHQSLEIPQSLVHPLSDSYSLSGSSSHYDAGVSSTPPVNEFVSEEQKFPDPHDQTFVDGDPIEDNLGFYDLGFGHSLARMECEEIVSYMGTI